MRNINDTGRCYQYYVHIATGGIWTQHSSVN